MITYTANSVAEYIAIVFNIYKKNNKAAKKHFMFRGLSNSSYKLEPSIFRHKNSLKQIKEKEVLLDFKQYAKEHNLNYDFIYECDMVLGDMQHHGIPTRLLDWTVSPLTALYFACQNSRSCCSDSDHDAVVYMLDPWTYNSTIVNYQQPQIHEIHILARSLLAYGWDLCYIEKLLRMRFPDCCLTNENVEDHFAYVGTFTNKNKLHQRGCFTIAGTGSLIFDSSIIAKQHLEAIYIPKAAKPKILDELNMLYINDYSVYPNLEGISRMIANRGSLFNL